MLGLPALVFDVSGKIMAANPLIESLTGYVYWRARDKVSLVDRSADALFQQAVAMGAAAGSGPTRSFALKGNEDQPAMIAHIVPIRLSARDIFARSAGVLMLTPVTLAEAPPVELVQSLFDLTPAEARVARSLTSGHSAEQIAADSGVSINTVRTQLRGVLEKTGCTRQAEVVSLLGGMLVP
jgi:DNA-binding CsgD family transcriptional regulator